MTAIKILIVEDEGIAALDLQQSLRNMGYIVTEVAATGEEAVKAAKELQPDLVLMDIRLQGEVDGTKAAEIIHGLFGIPIIYLTAYTDEDTLLRAMSAQPYGYIVKPFKERELHTAIKMALSKHNAEKKYIAERKQAEETLWKLNDELEWRVRERTAELRQAEQKYRSIFENAIEGIFQAAPDGRYLIANQSMARILGYDNPEEVVSQSSGVTYESSLVAGEAIHCRERQLCRRDGDVIWVSESVRAVHDDTGRVLYFEGTMEDITKRKEAEQALRESEERYRQIVETASEGILLLDGAGRITFANKKMAEMLDCTVMELVGGSFYDFVDKEWIDQAEEFIKRRQVRELPEIMFHRSDGKELWASLSTNPLLAENGQYSGALVMVTDITGRKQFEKELARLDRLHLVGEMAAGIGHEIRNPMTTVRGLLQYLGAKNECSKYNKHFELMIEELDRANSIISEFLSLARNKVVELTTQNLNTIIETMLPLLESTALLAGKGIRIETGNIPYLNLNEKEIRQLILNLVRNGLEAMAVGGNLTIKTFEEDQAVVLAVQDEGKGIEPAMLEKIGTPFFTTKEHGTGLGLAVCYSIAARHNAIIDIATGCDGTTFFIRFKRGQSKDSRS